MTIFKIIRIRIVSKKIWTESYLQKRKTWSVPNLDQLVCHCWGNMYRFLTSCEGRNKRDSSYFLNQVFTSSFKALLFVWINYLLTNKNHKNGRKKLEHASWKLKIIIYRNKKIYNNIIIYSCIFTIINTNWCYINHILDIFFSSYIHP